jgi:rubrerythrin
MAKPKPKANESEISRDRLAELLNEDLSREYQAIIAYVVYSQVLSGAEYMDIAAQLEIHAKQELDHALDPIETDRLSRQDANGDSQASAHLKTAERNAKI